MKNSFKFLKIIIFVIVMGLLIAACNNSGGGSEDNTPLPIEGFEWINSGTFLMGSPAGEPGRLNEPQHLVKLTKGFYMGKYVVTQEQYQAVMGSNPSNFKSAAAAGEIQEKRPVEKVSWYDAIVFCNKLSMKEGLTPVYTISVSTDPAVWGIVPTASDTAWNAVQANWNANGYRLPTEAEWEYACRAGTITAYNTGDSISNDTGWYLDNSTMKTHEVGKLPANKWGLYDMHGNVYEWCWDWRATYTGEDQIDPKGPDSGTSRIFRGGAYPGEGKDLRSAFRGGDYQPGDNTHSGIGFRVVRN